MVLGASINYLLELGFGAQYIRTIIRNHQNGIGDYIEAPIVPAHQVLFENLRQCEPG